MGAPKSAGLCRTTGRGARCPGERQNQREPRLRSANTESHRHTGCGATGYEQAMVATCHFRSDCRSGARRIPRFAGSHGPAQHPQAGDFTCAGLSTRDRSTRGGTTVGTTLARVGIIRTTVFNTLAVVCASITRVTSTGSAVTCNTSRADTSRTALTSGTNSSCCTATSTSTGTCYCIQPRRHASRSISDPGPSGATKRGGPAERPNCERPCRNRHASRTARRACACSEDSTCTKH
jgi:hypothetical protein